MSATRSPGNRLILVGLAVFLGSFAVPRLLPPFLRTDLAGDAMLGGCLALVMWVVAVVLVVVGMTKRRRVDPE